MVETLRVKMEVDTSEAETNIKRVRGELKDTKKESKGTTDQFSQLSDTLGKLSPNLGRFTKSFSQAFTGIKTNMASTTKGMKDMGKGMKESANGAKGAFAGVLSALGPIAVALAAIVAALAALRKAWETAKKAFKAFDPTGYARTFGAFQREMRKLFTALGALLSPIVKEIMEFLIGGVAYLRDMVEGLVRVKAFIDGIGESIKPISDSVGQIMSSLNGFGFISQFIQRGREEMEEMGEVIEEATKVGLASFDKLNNIGLEEGDADERQKMIEAMEEAREQGRHFLDDLSRGLQEAWNGFTKWASDAWDSISRELGRFWDWITSGAGRLWDGFVSWGMQAWSSITSVASDAWSAITSSASTIWSGFVSFGTRAWEDMRATASNIWNGLTSAIISTWDRFVSIGRTAWSAVTAFGSSVWNGLSSTLAGVWSSFERLGKDAWNAVIQAGQWFNNNIIDPIIQAVEWVWDKVKGILDFVKGIADGIGSLLGLSRSSSASASTSSSTASVKSSWTTSDSTGDIGKNTPLGVFGLDWGYSDGKITDDGGQLVKGRDNVAKIYGQIYAKYAKGAANGELFMPNNPVLRVLGDNTTEPEVAAPYSMIVSAVMTALGQANMQGLTSGNGKPIDITLNIDGKRLARMQYDNNMNETIRRNGSGAA